MRKLAIIVLLSLVVVGLIYSQAKPGGIARQVSMGGSMTNSNLVLNPFIIDDPALLLLNPAYQGIYNDYLWSNIAGGRIEGNSSNDNGYGNQNAGVAFSVADAFAVGLIMSYDPTSVNSLQNLLQSYPQYQRSSQTVPQIYNVWELVGSYKLSSMTLGLGLMYGWSNRTDDYKYTSPISTQKNERYASLLSVRVGAIMGISDDLSLDFSGHLRLGSATDKITRTPEVTGNGGEYEASGTEMLLYARAKMKVSDKFNFVPYGMFGFGSAEPKEKTQPTGLTKATAKLEYSTSVYALGIGGEYKTQNFYFAGGLSFQHYAQETDRKRPGGASDTLKNTWIYTGLPVINLGGEWWLTEWLSGRIGYFRSIGSYNYKNEYPNYTYESNQSYEHSWLIIGGLNPSSYDGIVTLGVGFKFGGFALDATVSEEALRRGLGLIGSNNGINTFGYLTASYNFAE